MSQDLDVDLMFRDLMACQYTLSALLSALVVTHPDPEKVKAHFKSAMELAPKVRVPYGKSLTTDDAIYEQINRAFQAARRQA